MSAAATLDGPLFRYAGAKWRLARWIISHFPRHETYLEPYLGSGCVFFQKSPSRSEYLVDVDQHIVDFFRLVRTQPDALAHALSLTPYARAEYEDAFRRLRDDLSLEEDELERVRVWLIAQQMSYGGNGHARGKISWRHNGKESGHGGVIAQWRNLPRRVHAACERLSQAQIECRPALEAIETLDGPDVLIYADPPYPDSTRRRQGEHGRLYRHEMQDDASHLALLDALDAHRGMVVLSGYACALYDTRLAHWHRVTRVAAAQGGQPREEVLWLNPHAVTRLADERAAELEAARPLFTSQETLR